MDFIVRLPRTHAGDDSIWVVVDRLTKVAHFIPVETTYNSAVLAELYISRIVCLHGVPKKIVSDRGTQFTSHFSQQLHEALGTQLKFSPAYHPQTYGQTKNEPDSWRYVESLCIARQVRLGQEAIVCRILLQQQLPSQSEDVTVPSTYGRNCRTPFHWDQPSERHVFGPDILLEAEENIRMVRENLKTTQSRQRSYADT
jgi:transposase InsO family protein